MSGIVGWIAAPHGAPDAAALGADARGARAPRPRPRPLCEFVRPAARATGAAIIDPRRRADVRRRAGLALTFNGEIYNFRELRAQLAKRGYASSATPTPRCCCAPTSTGARTWCKHLRGMFAFAIWDARNERLFLARDRFGEKPLFLREGDGELLLRLRDQGAAAAAARAARGGPRRAVWDYLAYRYVPGPRTLFAASASSPPGHLRDCGSSAS